MTSRTKNPLLDVLINEERITQTASSLDKKTAQLHERMSTMIYRHEQIKEEVFGDESGYSKLYSNLLRKMKSLVDQQSDIYNQIKEGIKEMGNIDSTEVFLDDVNKLEKMVCSTITN